MNFSTKEVLIDSEVPEQSVTAFNSDVKTCLKGFVEKLKERSKLKHKIVSNLDCLNPKSIKQRSVSTLTKKMDGCLMEISKANILSKEECNSVESEYKTMLKDVKPHHMEKLEEFDISVDRLDTFYDQQLSSSKKYPNLY